MRMLSWRRRRKVGESAAECGLAEHGTHHRLHFVNPATSRVLVVLLGAASLRI
jgi:hypothetical protein